MKEFSQKFQYESKKWTPFSIPIETSVFLFTIKIFFLIVFWNFGGGVLYPMVQITFFTFRFLFVTSRLYNKWQNDKKFEY